MTGVRPLLCGGWWAEGSATAPVIDPDTGEAIAEVALAGPNDVEHAIRAAKATMRREWPADERAVVLEAAAGMVAASAEKFATVIAAEGIKTVREARQEVGRAVGTLRLSADAARHADRSASGDGWRGFVSREPVGIVAAVTPYNDPLNLVAHKVGPALAAGAPVIVKPDPRTPLSALHLAVELLAAGVPAGWLSVLPAYATVAESLVSDRRVRLVSFTGGRVTGALVRRAADGKRLVMELGGICPTIVMANADIEAAVPALVDGAFAAAGQNCLHVQRILIHADHYDQARAMLIEATQRVRPGAKTDPATDIGPMIDAAALARVDRIVDEARAAGANILTGGGSEGPRYHPTLVEELPRGTTLAEEEVFGPVTVIERFQTTAEAIELATRGDGGVQAGIFAGNVGSALEVARALDVGSVVIGGTSDNRSDAMPFGGTGQAGIGREGIPHAVDAMTEPKTMLFVDS
nr:Aldehyde dehydrogenase [Kibdelosporangium sp. MJ126-NF4]CTQ97233.1 Aldehyde dehydrogenase (EC 1.2.1.3) [Kibdelosporangium sp. MJ126-NF4]